MGRARIINHLGLGQYRVEIERRRDHIDAWLSQYDKNIFDKQVQIDALQVELEDRTRAVLADDTAGDRMNEKTEEEAGGELPTPPVWDPVPLINAINVERGNIGHDPVTSDGTLNGTAQAQAVYMKNADRLTSTFSGGISATDHIIGAGYGGATVARGVLGGQFGVLDVINDVLNVGGYRSMVLAEKYTNIGVGFSYDGNSTYGYFYCIDMGGP